MLSTCHFNRVVLYFIEYISLKDPTDANRRKLRCDVNTPRGAHLILQLHDELIYEVNANDVVRVANIVRQCMESARELSVKMPVKVKVGPTWGRLEDYVFDT